MSILPSRCSTRRSPVWSSPEHQGQETAGRCQVPARTVDLSYRGTSVRPGSRSTPGNPKWGTTMTLCPSSEQLQRLLADRMTGPEAEAVEAHVQTCTGCQQALEQLTRSPDA